MKGKVGTPEDFPEGEVRVVRVQGERVAICKLEGALYAFEDRCTHDDAPLGEGALLGCEVVCPRHGARFNVKTGFVTRPPAVYPIETYAVEVKEGQVEITLPD